MKASILTGCRNCGPWLGQCVKSVLSQEYKDWEMIIVDDASNDNSRKVMRKFSKRDSRIKAIGSDKRLKCGGAYKKALEHASGDICCVVDADDALSHNRSLLKLIKLYGDNPDVGYIWTQFYLCDSNLKKLKKGFCKHPGDMSLLEAGIKGRHCFSHWRTFRTELRDKGEIFRPGLRAAVDKWMGYALEELAVGGFTNRAFYCYRQRIGGLSFTGRKLWKKMKVEFTQKRENLGITPFPIRDIT